MRSPRQTEVSPSSSLTHLGHKTQFLVCHMQYVYATSLRNINPRSCRRGEQSVQLIWFLSQDGSSSSLSKAGLGLAIKVKPNQAHKPNSTRLNFQLVELPREPKEPNMLGSLSYFKKNNSPRLERERDSQLFLIKKLKNFYKQRRERETSKFLTPNP